MSGSARADLIHKVNNLLSVIYTQVEVGRGRATAAGALAALEEIQRTAEATVPFVRQAIAAEGGGDASGRDAEGRGAGESGH